jgi:hypothetical protein
LSVQGQRYDASGSAVGSEFQINTRTFSNQFGPSVAVEASGSFVVAWTSYGSTGSDLGFSVQGQRYDTSGNAVGSEFQVNTYTTSIQRAPSAVIGADGEVLIFWHSNGSADSDSDSFSVQGQRYDAVGNAIGSEFQVNSYTTASQSYSSAAIDANGDFVVVWQSDGSAETDTLGFSIQGVHTLPEPSEFWMLGAGLAFLATVGRRRIRA